MQFSKCLKQPNGLTKLYYVPNRINNKPYISGKRARFFQIRLICRRRDDNIITFQGSDDVIVITIHFITPLFPPLVSIFNRLIPSPNNSSKLFALIFTRIIYYIYNKPEHTFTLESVVSARNAIEIEVNKKQNPRTNSIKFYLY